jgi:putative lipoic acid-binding regulatory protein
MIMQVVGDVNRETMLRLMRGRPLSLVGSSVEHLVTTHMATRQETASGLQEATIRVCKKLSLSSMGSYHSITSYVIFTNRHHAMQTCMGTATELVV